MTQQKNEGKEDGKKKKVVTVELIKWKIDKQLKMLRKNKLLSKVCSLLRNSNNVIKLAFIIILMIKSGLKGTVGAVYFHPFIPP